MKTQTKLSLRLRLFMTVHVHTRTSPISYLPTPRHPCSFAFANVLNNLLTEPCWSCVHYFRRLLTPD